MIHVRGPEVRHLYDERAPTGRVGKATVRRASNVDPWEPATGDDAAVKTAWLVDLGETDPHAPRLGPFGTRAEALDAEREWINNWLVTGRGGG